ncbi:MAG: hypothetical protein E6R08_06695 [Nevskiaceae bacterium]|nr:MAG: hypothetical protein E6R08_06695 [Nevskiaceae bacterium]
MSSRRYVKRVWRVPKDRGATTYFAALVHKTLVKHGWPATVRVSEHLNYFLVLHHDTGEEAPDDFWNAVSIAVRIIARTHRVDVIEQKGYVELQREYIITSGGFFKEK